jgi:U5 small nuclear ribonucleoprotein component
MFDDFSKGLSKGPLIINIVKYYNKPDCKTFDVFGRVLSGRIQGTQKVKILG